MEWPRDVASIAQALSHTRAWFWLDGTAAEPGGEPGLSYLGAALEVRLATRGHERDFLRDLRHDRGDPQNGEGWVVALSYEFGVALLGEDPAADDVPPAFALRAETVLVLNHATERAEVRGPDEVSIARWLAQYGLALQATRQESQASHGAKTFARWHRSEREYLSDVEACRAAIREGDAYVLCLTDVAESTPVTDTPLELYLRLRDAGAAARGGILVTEDRALISASPERFLSARGSRVATHPIKGTRPRGATPERDAELALELAADPKERAENLMIVDLMRNDLSRVCTPGSVATEGFLRVETHPRVHQLVSTVAGELRDGADIFDVIEACFPGGSMTGAPKRRAVQILASLELAPRGLYSGCFGWLGDDGDAELAMAIRCIELRGEASQGRLARVGAGGGVTSDSVASAELAEKNLKAAPLLAALAPE